MQTTTDVRDREAMRAWFDATDDERPFDLVIANAGIFGPQEGRTDFETHVRDAFAINVDGALNTINPALARMKERGRGQIAIMSSLASFRGMPGATAYSATKAAIRFYGEGLRAELRFKGIEVSVACPGFVRSRMTEKNRFSMPMLMDADRAARIIRRGLERNKERIAFPFPMYAAVWIMAATPSFIADRVFRRARAGGGA